MATPSTATDATNNTTIPTIPHKTYLFFVLPIVGYILGLLTAAVIYICLRRKYCSVCQAPTPVESSVIKASKEAVNNVQPQPEIVIHDTSPVSSVLYEDADEAQYAYVDLPNANMVAYSVRSSLSEDSEQKKDFEPDYDYVEHNLLSSFTQSANDKPPERIESQVASDDDGHLKCPHVWFSDGSDADISISTQRQHNDNQNEVPDNESEQDELVMFENYNAYDVNDQEEPKQEISNTESSPSKSETVSQNENTFSDKDAMEIKEANQPGSQWETETDNPVFLKKRVTLMRVRSDPLPMGTISPSLKFKTDIKATTKNSSGAANNIIPEEYEIEQEVNDVAGSSVDCIDGMGQELEENILSGYNGFFFMDDDQSFCSVSAASISSERPDNYTTDMDAIAENEPFGKISDHQVTKDHSIVMENGEEEALYELAQSFRLDSGIAEENPRLYSSDEELGMTSF